MRGTHPLRQQSCLLRSMVRYSCALDHWYPGQGGYMTQCGATGAATRPNGGNFERDPARPIGSTPEAALLTSTIACGIEEPRIVRRQAIAGLAKPALSLVRHCHVPPMRTGLRNTLQTERWG